MSNIYVRDMNRPRKGGRSFFVVLLLAGIAGGAYWYFFVKPAKPSAAPTTEIAPLAPVAPALPAPSLSPAKPTEPAPQPIAAPQPTLAQPAAARPVSNLVPSALQQAIQLHSEGELLPARTLLLDLLKQNLTKSVEHQTKELIGDINIQLAISTRRAPEKALYTVKSGDSFWKISRSINGTVEYLQRANGISPNALRPGQQLYYMTGEFSIEVDLSDYTLTLLHNGTFFKEYLVGVGREDRTPPGQYTVGTKIVHPPWDRNSKGLGVIPYGDPRNQLGECWMSLVPSSPGLPMDLGIHGTAKPDTVGTDASAGCVRMRNHEVVELYAFILPGVQVNIRD